MKKTRYYWIDGKYIEEGKADRLYPEGYDKTFSKSVYVDTIGEKLSGIMHAVSNMCMCGVVLTAALYFASMV